MLDSNHPSQREALSFSCTDMVPGTSLEAWLHAFLLSAFQVRLSSLKWKQFGGTQRKPSLTSGLRNSSATSVQLVINTLPLSVLRSSPLSADSYAYILLHVGGVLGVSSISHSVYVCVCVCELSCV